MENLQVLDGFTTLNENELYDIDGAHRRSTEYWAGYYTGKAVIATGVILGGAAVVVSFL